MYTFSIKKSLFTSYLKHAVNEPLFFHNCVFRLAYRKTFSLLEPPPFTNFLNLPAFLKERVYQEKKFLQSQQVLSSNLSIANTHAPIIIKDERACGSKKEEERTQKRGSKLPLNFIIHYRSLPFTITGKGGSPPQNPSPSSFSLETSQFLACNNSIKYVYICAHKQTRKLTSLAFFRGF